MQTKTRFDFLPTALQEQFQASSGRVFSVTNPATGDSIVSIADCGAAEAQSMANAAVEGFSLWKNVTSFERSAIMRRWYNLMVEHESEMARLMSMEMGKPVTEARGEVRYAAGVIEWYS